MRQKLNWMNANALSREVISKTLKTFLLEPGSFIQHLKKCGIQTVDIKILTEDWRTPQFDERKILGLSDRQYALVREVAIYTHDKIWMKARTVVPRQTLTGKEQQLGRLKTRSLGSILFKDKKTKRSSFQFLKISTDTDDFLQTKQLVKNPTMIYARRSQFSIAEKKLLLTEIFLPSVETV